MHIASYSSIIKTKYFDLSIKNKNSNIFLTMEMKCGCFNTSKITNLSQILKQLLPSIFCCECFNSENLPFSKELHNTETGHLFEHILLEYMCKIKKIEGFRDVEFKGKTTWDWNIEKEGIFHINVNAGLSDRVIFDKALYLSIALMEHILNDFHEKQDYACASANIESILPLPIES